MPHAMDVDGRGIFNEEADVVLCSGAKTTSDDAVFVADENRSGRKWD